MATLEGRRLSTSWFSVILSLYVCDKWDERIVAMIERCVRKRAPAHHYAVLVTDLDDDDNADSVHKFFDASTPERRRDERLED